MRTWSQQINDKAWRSPDMMGGPTRRFFGGGSTTKVIDPKTWEQRNLIAQLDDPILQALQVGGRGYRGQRIPGASALQRGGFDVARGLTPVASGGQQFGANLLAGLDPGAPGRITGAAEGALTDILKPTDPSKVVDYWTQAFADPAIKNLTDRILPAVAERYAGKGSHGATTGGAFGRGLGRAAGDVSTNINAQLANLLFGTEQADANRRLAGISAGANLAQTPGAVAGQGETAGLTALSQLLNIGGLQRGIIGEQKEDQFQRWLGEGPGYATGPYANPNLNLLPLMLGVPGNTLTLQQRGPGAAAVAPAAGAFLGTEFGAGAAGGLASGAWGALGTLASWI